MNTYSLTVRFADGSTGDYARCAASVAEAIAMLATGLWMEEGKEVVSIGLSDF